MPTYEYACPSCKKSYELRESFSAPTQHTCQECGKGTAKRVLHAPPVVFKGSGWYVTDSKKSSSAVTAGDSSADSDSTTSSPDSGGSETTLESAAN